MNNKILSMLTVAAATVSLFFSACEEDVSGIGSSISTSEVSIQIDSLSYNLFARTIPAPSFESQSSYTLLGSISVPEYGNLECSYVTQWLPAETLNIPDSITAAHIDSVKMILTVPKNYITGDTLAPQQLKVYSLIKQLPTDINSNFDPSGYYDQAAPLASKSYTLSGYTFNDSTFLKTQSITVKANLPVKLGRDVVEAYATNPDLFVWPQEFAKKWPGIFVEPSFGKGCIAPVQNTSIFAYFPQTRTGSYTDENGESHVTTTQVADSVCLFTTAPEVISSVNISYQPSQNIENLISQGKSIITTPGGYTVAFTFPAKEILRDYWEEEYDLGVINNLKFTIGAKSVTNSYGIGVPPALLLVKTSELDSFFSEGKLPDNISSFTSIYSSDSNSYTFSSMRKYIVDLREKGEENIVDDDINFTLVPVSVMTEDYTDPSSYNTVTAITAITPYIIKPTMVELDTENAQIVFTFSNETLF